MLAVSRPPNNAAEQQALGRRDAMTLSQSKAATKDFVAVLEAQLFAINPAYERNRKVRGVRHEYTREIEDGVFAIHSVLCMRGTFYHCFCLSLHQSHTSQRLYSPFTAGGRCDHNYSVTTACHRDLGLSPIDPVSPFLMSDSHHFRKGADRIVQRCTAEAEARLLPFYHSVWRELRLPLNELLQLASTATPLDLASAASSYPGELRELSCHMLEFRSLHNSVSPAVRPSFLAATVMANLEHCNALNMSIKSRVARPN